MDHSTFSSALRDAVLAAAAAPGILGAAARFHLVRPGKQVRGRLALDVAAALGSPGASALSLATACELLHNASLVHDDVQDGDVVRRGREAVWSRFGRPIAINLGDHLLASAFRVLAEARCDAEARAQLLARFAQATSQLARGQSDEILRRDEGSMDFASYESIAAAKTGPLMALPVEGALILAQAPAAQRDAARRGCMSFGTAFQILDDIADLLGTKQRLERGRDLVEGKLTWPMLSFLQHADDELAARLRGFVDGPRASRADVDTWVQTLLASGAVARATDRAEQLLGDAARAWQQLPQPARDALAAISDSVAGRRRGDHTEAAR